MGVVAPGKQTTTQSLQTFAKRLYIVLFYLYELIIQQYREYFTPAQYCTIQNTKFFCILYQFSFIHHSKHILHYKANLFTLCRALYVIHYKNHAKHTQTHFCGKNSEFFVFRYMSKITSSDYWLHVSPYIPLPTWNNSASKGRIFRENYTF